MRIYYLWSRCEVVPFDEIIATGQVGSVPPELPTSAEVGAHYLHRVEVKDSEPFKPSYNSPTKGNDR